MNENIYTRNNEAPAVIIKPCIFAIFLMIGLGLQAQQHAAHNVRNISGNGFNTAPTDARATLTTVKSLSTLPTVTPGNNSASLNKSNATTANPGNTGMNVNASNSTITGNILHSDSPAKLSSFSGVSENGQYRLTWETVRETDVKQYEVEYSLNNRDFERAGTLAASNRVVYTFNHNGDAQQVLYYRLKVTDIRGTAFYSKSLVVKSSMARQADLVTPTIIRDGVLNITLGNSYKNVQLFNNAGIEVFREYLGGRTGNRIGLNLPDLPAGPYFVKLLGTNTSVTQRVMIL